MREFATLEEATKALRSSDELIREFRITSIEQSARLERFFAWGAGAFRSALFNHIRTAKKEHLQNHRWEYLTVSRRPAHFRARMICTLDEGGSGGSSGHG